MSCLRTPLALAASVALIPFALGCEVRVETPPEDHDPYDPLGTPPLIRYEDEDEPVPPDSWYGAPAPEPPPLVEPPYTGLSPDLYPTLIVIDADIIAGPLASNANADAAFSFRAQMEWLAGERDPVDFTASWLEQWETVTSVGPALSPVVPRPAARRLLLDPWWAVSPAGAADDQPFNADTSDASSPAYPGGAGAGGTLDALPSWANAPFRLIAIVNRVDLANDPCATGGEIRYVYTAIDPDGGDPLDMTIILEVPYPSTRPASEWARAWRDLASALPSDAAYAAALERLVRDVRAEADPLRARLLSSEVALASDDSPGWEMREFHLQVDNERLALVQAPLDHTPRADVDAARLSDHVLDNADAIRGAGVPLPQDMQAGAAPLATPDFRWRVLGVSESLRHAFSIQTCNGCHGGDAQALPFQHITPLDAPGISARVSRSLHDPDAPSDELRRRLERLEILAQSECEVPVGGGVYP